MDKNLKEKFLDKLIRRFDVQTDSTYSYDHTLNILWMHVFLELHTDYRQLCHGSNSEYNTPMINKYFLVISDIQMLKILVQIISDDGLITSQDYSNSMMLFNKLKSSIKHEYLITNFYVNMAEVS